MGVIQIVVIVGTVQISRHHRDKIAIVLRTIILAQFNTGNLGDSVRLVSMLEGAGQ